MRNKVFAGVLILGLMLAGCGTVKNHTNGDRTPLVQYLPQPPEPPPTAPETAAADLIALQVNADNLNKSFYFPGDKLDITGLELTGDFGEEGNAIRKPVNFNILNFSPDTLTKSGVATINVQVNEITTNFTVMVDTLTNLIVTSNDGTCLIFPLGGELDRSKLKLLGRFQSGINKILPIDVITGDITYNDNNEGSKTARVSVNVGSEKSNTVIVYSYPLVNGIWTPDTSVKTNTKVELSATSGFPLKDAIYKDITKQGLDYGLVVNQNTYLKNVTFREIRSTGTSSGHFATLGIQGVSLENVVIEDIEYTGAYDASFSVQFSRANVSLKNVVFNNITREDPYAGLYFGGTSSYYSGENANKHPSLENVTFNNVEKMHLPPLTGTHSATYSGRIVFTGNCTRVGDNSNLATNAGISKIVTLITDKILVYNNGVLESRTNLNGSPYTGPGSEKPLAELNQYGE